MFVHSQDGSFDEYQTEQVAKVPGSMAILGSMSSDEGEGYDDDVSCGSDDDYTDLENPSWASLLPVQYSIGRSGQEDASSNSKNAPSVRDAPDTLSVYGEAQVLNHTIDALDGPRIRLLQIRPEVDYKPIHVDLMARPVFDAPPYLALSYSWGHATSERNIFVGRSATPFPISTHLWNALRRLRDPQKVVCVWVDAICINQQNPLDKASQVQMMAQIYSEAEEVRIWLGDTNFPEDDSTLFGLLCQQPRPWWKRLWIIQECAYARRCPIVMLGDLSISLEEFVRRWSETTKLDGLSTDARQMLEKNLESLSVPLYAWKQAETEDFKSPLLLRLRETAGRQCTDPRDRIYALLNLVAESEAQMFPPDYRKPYAELRAEVEKVLRQSALWDEDQDKGLLRPDTPRKVQVMLEAIMTASRNGNTERLRDLLNTDRLPDMVDDLGPALQAAVVGGHHETVKLLLYAGTDVNAMESLRVSHMYTASRLGHHGVVKLLLDAGATGDVNALYTASYRGHREVVRLLLDAGVEVDAPSEQHEDGNALYAASRGGDAEVVKLLLGAGANADAWMRRNATGSVWSMVVKHARAMSTTSPLWIASSGGHREVVKLLLDAGAAPGPSQALYAASSEGHHKTVELLLDAGATGYSRDLQAAAAKGSHPTVKLLLDAGVAADGRAVHAASAKGSWRTVKLLVDTGVAVASNTLSAASARGDREIVKLLLDAGAAIDSTALYTATAGGYRRTVELLLEAGAAVDKSILYAAKVGGHQEILKMILDAATDISADVDTHDGSITASTAGDH